MVVIFLEVSCLSLCCFSPSSPPNFLCTKLAGSLTNRVSGINSFQCFQGLLEAILWNKSSSLAGLFSGTELAGRGMARVRGIRSVYLNFKFI